jgi:acyl carrier protein
MGKEDIKRLVIASGRRIAQIQDIGYSDNLLEYGFNSMTIVNLIDALETRFDIQVNIKEDLKFLTSIEAIHKLLLIKGVDQ